MEEGEGEGLERIDVIEDSKKNANPTAVPVEQVEEKKEEVVVKQSIVDEKDDKRLRAEWTKMFLFENGFEFILDQFMQKQISTSTQATADSLRS